jgi:hypothetical protein
MNMAWIIDDIYDHLLLYHGGVLGKRSGDFA